MSERVRVGEPLIDGLKGDRVCLTLRAVGNTDRLSLAPLRFCNAARAAMLHEPRVICKPCQGPSSSYGAYWQC